MRNPDKNRIVASNIGSVAAGEYHASPTSLIAGPGMLTSCSVNPVTEHALFLILFVSNAGGW